MSLVPTAHPEASAEFDADITWYETRGTGLGARFEAAVYQVIDDPLAWPDSGAVWPKETLIFDWSVFGCAPEDWK